MFFIDAVKHYWIYEDDRNMQNGDYANIFEEELDISEALTSTFRAPLST
jgi:restriction endonuclease